MITCELVNLWTCELVSLCIRMLFEVKQRAANYMNGRACELLSTREYVRM